MHINNPWLEIEILKKIIEEKDTALDLCESMMMQLNVQPPVHGCCFEPIFKHKTGCWFASARKLGSTNIKTND